MYPYSWWWHGFGFMWIFPLLFLIVVVAFLVRGPSWSPRNSDRGERRETPREILDRRYASGVGGDNHLVRFSDNHSGRW